MTLWHQVFGEPVPHDGSEDHSLRSICVCDGCIPYFLLLLSLLWLVCVLTKDVHVFYVRFIGCDSLL